MSLIIDGYNLLHASGILGHGVGPGGLERSRLALLNFLVESLDAGILARTIVVFDAALAPPGLPRQVDHRGLTVRFAEKHHDSADELIEELIRLDPSPRRLTVVSSDHRLHRAAKRRKATPVDSDKWHAEIVRVRLSRDKTPPHVPKPGTPLSDYDVRFWLEKFGVELPPVEAAKPDPVETELAEPKIAEPRPKMTPVQAREGAEPVAKLAAKQSPPSAGKVSPPVGSGKKPAAEARAVPKPNAVKPAADFRDKKKTNMAPPQRSRRQSPTSKRPPHTDSSNPFPPGYADDLLEDEPN